MGLKELANKKLTIKAIEINLIMAFTILCTAFLVKIWPRFLNDVLTFPWILYVALITVLAVPFAKILNRVKTVK
ncbi:MAG: hypothetical protein GOU97_01615 [Nanoarchaeota archaeon]|nr:hypothetical protein [Nanoarchaeota archaeon]